MMCQEVVEYMHRQLDGDLDEQEQEILNEHTKHCPDCAALFDRLQKLSAELENLPRVMPKYSLVDAIMPQLEQLEPIVMKQAAAEPVQLQEAARRVKPSRKWPAFRAISGVVAAAAVAGLFIVSYNTDLFQTGSSNDSAQESAMLDTAASSNVRKMSEDEILQQYAAENKSPGDVNVESIAPDLPAAEDGSSQGFSTEEVPKSEAEGALSGEGISKDVPTEETGTGAGSTDKGLVPPVLQAESSDGKYTAQVYGYVIRLFKSGETDALLETTRKNGKIANLSWSEDNAELFYEIQLESGGMERYVIDVATLKETKAPH